MLGKSCELWRLGVMSILCARQDVIQFDVHAAPQVACVIHNNLWTHAKDSKWQSSAGSSFRLRIFCKNRCKNTTILWSLESKTNRKSHMGFPLVLISFSVFVLSFELAKVNNYNFAWLIDHSTAWWRYTTEASSTNRARQNSEWRKEWVMKEIVMHRYLRCGFAVSVIMNININSTLINYIIN